MNIKRVKHNLREYLFGDPTQRSWFSRFFCAPYNIPIILYDAYAENRGVFWTSDFPPVFRILVLIIAIILFPVWAPLTCCSGCVASLYQDWEDFDMTDFEDAPEADSESD